MKQYIVYDDNGVILSAGVCPDRDFFLQAEANEFVMEGVANDTTQKVVNPGIAGKVVDKDPSEIPQKPVPIPYGQRLARITNDGLANLLKDIIDLKDRISVLESEV